MIPYGSAPRSSATFDLLVARYSLDVASSVKTSFPSASVQFSRRMAYAYDIHFSAVDSLQLTNSLYGVKWAFSDLFRTIIDEIFFWNTRFLLHP